jgi:peptidoglycan hydrolase-like protein with peptidoglycan-binding domain
MLRRALALLGLLAAVLAAADARAERRVALVIGNATYDHASTLRNPINDARDIAATLKNLGFEVIVGTDLDQRAFASMIDQFGRMLDGADVGLFFYAGHGLQVNDKNYLVSTRAKLENEFLIPAETVELDAVIRLMESRSRINLVFLDACRNNPLADRLRQNLVAANRSVSLGRGLARIEPTGRDTLIAFAAAPGQEAADGRDRNSPFTAALLDHMPKPGVEVSVMLKEVTAQVRRETHNAQRPQQLSDMSRTFYFAKAAPAVAAAPPAKPVQTQSDHSIELAYWNSARSVNDCESVRAYLERYPSGIFADLARLSEKRLCDTSRKIAVIETVPPPAQQPPAPAVTALPQVQAPATSVSASPSEPQGTQVAALPDPTAPGPAPTPEPDSDVGADLARDLQRELARVGCSAGRPDGVWGSRSRDAVRQFNRYARASLDPDTPSQDALAVVREHRDRVCPLEEPVLTKPAPAKREREPARVREREREPARVRERTPASTAQRAPVSTPAKDWRSISPLCESAYPMAGGRMCCTYDPPNGAPQIICR